MSDVDNRGAVPPDEPQLKGPLPNPALLAEAIREAYENTRNLKQRTISSWQESVRRISIFAFILSMVVAALQVKDPALLMSLIANSTFIFAVLGCLISFAVAIFLRPEDGQSDSSFSEVDRFFGLVRTQRKIAGTSSAAEARSQNSEKESSEKSRALTPAHLAADQYFTQHLYQLIGDLDDQIEKADIKASKLLDAGTMYLRRGLYFYVASIVFWQCWGHWVAFNALVIAGIVSCSIAFVVVEFVAAWFLKQYRSYVDSSVTYMRVKSHFNRLLLSYYALNEYPGDGFEDSTIRAELTELLSQEIKWPDIKSVNSNDFNYMLESFGALNSSLEKAKSLLKPSKRPKPEKVT